MVLWFATKLNKVSFPLGLGPDSLLSSFQKMQNCFIYTNYSCKCKRKLYISHSHPQIQGNICINFFFTESHFFYSVRKHSLKTNIYPQIILGVLLNLKIFLLHDLFCVKMNALYMNVFRKPYMHTKKTKFDKGLFIRLILMFLLRTYVTRVCILLIVRSLHINLLCHGYTRVSSWRKNPNTKQLSYVNLYQITAFQSALLWYHPGFKLA